MKSPEDSGDFKLNWVSASDLGSHAFCARSAWLSFSGATHGAQSRLSRGQEAHARHGRTLGLQRLAIRAAVAAALLALVLLAYRLL